jgi:hypothetical protein
MEKWWTFPLGGVQVTVTLAVEVPSLAATAVGGDRLRNPVFAVLQSLVELKYRDCMEYQYSVPGNAVVSVKDPF